MKKSLEPILSQIILKYYKSPDDDDMYAPRFICAWCQISSNRSGGGFFDAEGIPKQICDTCAALRFREDHGFTSLKAAAARRRRIFDVGYLFNEKVLDMYMHKHGISAFEEFTNADEVFTKASGWYSTLFSKAEKIQLEEMEMQKDIEASISQRLASVNLDQLFM